MSKICKQAFIEDTHLINTFPKMIQNWFEPRMSYNLMYVSHFTHKCLNLVVFLIQINTYFHIICKNHFQLSSFNT